MPTNLKISGYFLVFNFELSPPRILVWPMGYPYTAEMNVPDGISVPMTFKRSDRSIVVPPILFFESKSKIGLLF